MKKNLIIFITLFALLLIPMNTFASAGPDCEEERLYLSDFVNVKNANNEKIEGSVFEWHTKMLDLDPANSQEILNTVSSVWDIFIEFSTNFTIEGYDVNKELVFKFESNPSKNLEDNLNEFDKIITPEIEDKVVYVIYKGIIDTKKTRNNFFN